MAAENEGSDEDDVHEGALAEQCQPWPMRNLFGAPLHRGKCRHQAGGEAFVSYFAGRSNRTGQDSGGSDASQRC